MMEITIDSGFVETNSSLVSTLRTDDNMYRSRQDVSTFNDLAIDVDFIIRKETTGEAYNYDAMTDNTTIDSDTVDINSNGITLTCTDTPQSGLPVLLGDDISASHRPASVRFNTRADDRDFRIFKQTSGEAYNYDAGTDVTTIDSSEFHVNDAGTPVTTYDDSLGIGRLEIGTGLTYINSSLTTRMRIGGDTALQLSTTNLVINTSKEDRDFIVEKHAIGTAFSYDAGTDTTTIDSDTINFVGNTFTGVAEKETGTWTPVFTNGGTEGAITATYSRVGNIVTINLGAAVGVSTSTSFYSITEASLPLQLANTNLSPSGTFFLGSDLFGAAAIVNGFGHNLHQA